MDVKDTSGFGRDADISVEEFAAKDDGGDKVANTCTLAGLRLAVRGGAIIGRDESFDQPFNGFFGKCVPVTHVQCLPFGSCYFVVLLCSGFNLPEHSNPVPRSKSLRLVELGTGIRISVFLIPCKRGLNIYPLEP